MDEDVDEILDENPPQRTEPNVKQIGNTLMSEY